jgi:hypothetical protein
MVALKAQHSVPHAGGLKVGRGCRLASSRSTPLITITGGARMLVDAATVVTKHSQSILPECTMPSSSLTAH